MMWVTTVMKCASGLLLLVGGLTSVATRWVAMALAIAGGCFLVSAGLGALELASIGGHGAATLRLATGAFGGGVLVTLFIAGEMKVEKLGKRRRDGGGSSSGEGTAR